MSAKSSQRLYEILAALEMAGPLGLTKLAHRVPGISESNVEHHITRAVQMGRAILVKDSKPKKYVVAPGWREAMASHHSPLPAERIEPATAMPAIKRKPMPIMRKPPALPSLAALHPLYAVWR